MIFLNIADAVTTHLGLARGFHEANPIMRFFIEGYGTFGMVGFKFIVLVLLGYLVYKGLISELSLWIMNGLVFFTVINNLIKLY